MVPTHLLCEGRAQKRNNGLCHHFSLGESWAPALTLMPHSIPPCISPVLFSLVWCSHTWVQREWLQVSLCRGPLRGTAWNSSTASIPTSFYSQKMWGLMFLALEPWAGEAWSGLWSLAPEITFPIFIYHHQCETSLLCVSALSTSLHVVSSLIPQL